MTAPENLCAVCDGDCKIDVDDQGTRALHDAVTEAFRSAQLAANHIQIATSHVQRRRMYPTAMRTLASAGNTLEWVRELIRMLRLPEKGE